MKEKILLFVFICLSSCCYSQYLEEVSGTEDVLVDEEYREDQFYLGISYNVVGNSDNGLTQSGFSGGLHAGFIRDFPVNERRNVALGIGVGVSSNTYNQNLFIGKDQSGQTVFRFLDNNEVDYDSNRFNTYLVELPLELRWRTSTPTDYQFWRIYGGVKFGYIYYFKSTFAQPGNEIEQTQVDELNRIRYGATLSIGRGNFNLNVYYSLNPFFDGATVDGRDVDFKTFKLGLMFYIL